MTGLILEGGGMRGIYTAGVLDCFHDNDLFFKYIVGVSAGTCHACSYISRQRGRNIKITDFIPDKRYMSIRNFIKTGSFFGMDFIFKEIPVNLLPFDYDKFFSSPDKFNVGAIDLETGKSHFFNKDEIDNDFMPIRASMSLPGISKIVKINGKKYLDGGVSSPIPIEKSILDGNDRHIIVLTQPKGYIKLPEKINPILSFRYRKYPKLLDALRKRHIEYNNSVQLAESLEQKNKVIIIRPSQDFQIGRLERDLHRINMQYDLGYSDANRLIDKIKAFI